MYKALAMLLLVMTVLLAGCSPSPPYVNLGEAGMSEWRRRDAVEPNVLYFGFDRRLEPSEDVRMYLPLLKYLEQQTGLRFKLAASTRTGSVVSDLGTGTIHLAAIGTLSYLEAHRRYGVEALVAGRTADGRASYRALIIARPDSPVQTLDDLRGRSFAFGSLTSTQGNLIPRVMLLQAGIPLSSLSGLQHHSSHFETARAVLSGRFDAGAIQDTLGRELVNQGKLRVVAESSAFPSSTISVAPGLPDQVVSLVRQALLDFDPLGRDKHGLYHWEQSEMPLGFTRVDQAALEQVHRLAEQVGLLK